LENHCIEFSLQNEDLGTSTRPELHTPEADISSVRWQELVRRSTYETFESYMQCSYWAPKGRNEFIKMSLSSLIILGPMRLRAFIEEGNDKSIIRFTWYVKQKSFIIAISKQALVTAQGSHAKRGDNRAKVAGESSSLARGAALPKGIRGSGAANAGEARPDLS